jgi:hypothetical protein
MAMLMLAVAGPLASAHANLHVATTGAAVASVETSAGTENPSAEPSSVKEGKQTPPAVQHQRCAVCPAMQAIGTVVPQVGFRQDLTAVTYGVSSIEDTAKFSPPPLLKPPRV